VNVFGIPGRVFYAQQHKATTKRQRINAGSYTNSL
jgi:hypothetical protein